MLNYQSSRPELAFGDPAGHFGVDYWVMPLQVYYSIIYKCPSGAVQLHSVFLGLPLCAYIYIYIYVYIYIYIYHSSSEPKGMVDLSNDDMHMI